MGCGAGGHPMRGWDLRGEERRLLGSGRGRRSPRWTHCGLAGHPHIPLAGPFPVIPGAPVVWGVRAGLGPERGPEGPAQVGTQEPGIVSVAPPGTFTVGCQVPPQVGTLAWITQQAPPGGPHLG